MIRSPLLKFIFVMTIISPFFFPGPGAAKVDLEKTSITLNLSDKPTGDILKEIEKQTTYTIEILDYCEAESLEKVLNTKKSIILNQTPLDQALSRLLKDFNYSVISNARQKTLTLVLLNKNDGSYFLSSENDKDASFLIAMDDLDATLDKYNPSTLIKNNLNSTQTQGEAPEMDGIDIALETYSKALDNNTEGQLSTQMQGEAPEMDGIDIALEAYSEAHDNNTEGQLSTQMQGEAPEMDGIDIALETYSKALDNNTEGQLSTQMQGEAPEMDGIDIALEGYYKALDKSN